MAVVLLDLDASLVYVLDTKSFGCTSCPKVSFPRMDTAFNHALRHQHTCPMMYPMCNNEKLVGWCYSNSRHDECRGLVRHGCIVVIISESGETKFMCNLNEVNEEGEIVNKQCGECFSSVHKWETHVRHHLKKLKVPEMKTIKTVSKLLSQFKTTRVNVCKKIVHDYDRIQAEKAKAKEHLKYMNEEERLEHIRWQLKIPNLISQVTLSNYIFINKVVGFDIRKLPQTHNGKQISSKMLGKKIRELMPHVRTKYYCQCKSIFIYISVGNLCQKKNIKSKPIKCNGKKSDGKKCKTVVKDKSMIYSCSNETPQHKHCNNVYNLCASCAKTLSAKKIVLTAATTPTSKTTTTMREPQSKNGDDSIESSKTNENSVESSVKSVLFMFVYVCICCAF